MANEIHPKDSVKREGSGRSYGLTMDRRDRVTLTGVSDVMSFDEQSVILKTDGGEVTITGIDLHVARLMIEEGHLVIDGTIDSVAYHDHVPTKKTARMLGRLFK